MADPPTDDASATSVSLDIYNLLLTCSCGLSALADVPSNWYRETLGPSTAEHIAQAYAKSLDLVRRCYREQCCDSPAFVADVIRLSFCILHCECALTLRQHHVVVSTNVLTVAGLMHPAFSCLADGIRSYSILMDCLALRLPFICRYVGMNADLVSFRADVCNIPPPTATILSLLDSLLKQIVCA